MMANFSKWQGPFRDPGPDPLDFRFVRWLCRENKLALIPPSAFYSEEFKKDNENLVRICFFKVGRYQRRQRNRERKIVRKKIKREIADERKTEKLSLLLLSLALLFQRYIPLSLNLFFIIKYLTVQLTRLSSLSL